MTTITKSFLRLAGDFLLAGLWMVTLWLLFVMVCVTCRAQGVNGGGIVVSPGGGSSTTIPGIVTASPSTTLFSFNGSAMSGLTTTLASGSTLYLAAGTYYLPVFPVFASNVTIIGAGQNSTFLIRTNWGGAGATNQTDDLTVGPFFQPNTGTVLSGVTLIATNITNTTTGQQSCFGISDKPLVSATTNAVGFTNTLTATNVIVQNCTLYGSFASTSCRGQTKIVTDSITFIGVNFLSGYDCVYNGGVSSVTNNHFGQAIGCTYTALEELNGSDQFAGAVAGVHLNGGNVSAAKNVWKDSGGTFLLHATTSVSHAGFIDLESTAGAGTQVYLDNPSFAWTANQVTNYPELNNETTTGAAINGYYFNTNNYPLNASSNSVTANPLTISTPYTNGVARAWLTVTVNSPLTAVAYLTNVTSGESELFSNSISSAMMLLSPGDIIYVTNASGTSAIVKSTVKQ